MFDKFAVDCEFGKFVEVEDKARSRKSSIRCFLKRFGFMVNCEFYSRVRNSYDCCFKKGSLDSRWFMGFGEYLRE